MKKTKIVKEVLDNDGNIMSRNSMGPENNLNNKSTSTKTTDYNTIVGRQKFNFNFLGRFGFHFYEGKDGDEKKLIDIIAELEFEQYQRFLEFFMKNFSKDNLKIWKDVSDKKFDELDEKEKESDYTNAALVLDAIKKYLKDKRGDKTITEDIVSDKRDNDIVVDKFFDNIKKDDKEILTKIKERVNKLLKDCK